MDFSDHAREQIFEYVKQKYGADHFVHIGTYTTLGTRSVLKDIGRGLGIDHNEINDINKFVPVIQGKVHSIEQCLEEVPEIQAFQEKYPKLFELASKVQKLPRSASTHACGILVMPDSVIGNIPLMKTKEGDYVTEYEGPVLEHMGYIKLDFLSIKNLDILEMAFAFIKERHNVNVDFHSLEPDDQSVFLDIKNGETTSIFQLESDGMTAIYTGLNTVDFESLIAGVSMYR